VSHADLIQAVSSPPRPFGRHLSGYCPSAWRTTKGDVTTTIAVIGATGTAGSRVIARLRGRDIAVVEACRAHGIDLVSGQGLSEALAGVDVVIDVSDPKQADDDDDTAGTIITAAHNLVDACTSQGIERLVVSTLAAIDDPVFDGIPFFTAKRAAEEIVLDSPVRATIVKSTQWHEFATNTAAVTFDDHEVVAEDWLIQPIAADTVADVLVEAALGQTRTPRTISSPQRIRLPELVSKLLAWRGDHRRLRVVQPALTALAQGALLAPDHAILLGPDVDAWLHTQPGAGAETGPRGEDSDKHANGPGA
jgi:uncharacterized protein YbjT (DUF2867 family)